MRKVISFAFVVGAVFHLTGCRALPADRELIGERLCGEDGYTGRYLAECSGDTGKDVVFGGDSIEERKLYVCGCIFVCSGEAVIRIRMNEDVLELEPDDDGFFEARLSLTSGGNYIMVQYQDFAGTVELTVGYGQTYEKAQAAASGNDSSKAAAAKRNCRALGG